MRDLKLRFKERRSTGVGIDDYGTGDGNENGNERGRDRGAQPAGVAAPLSGRRQVEEE
jgi:hypothetical protein